MKDTDNICQIILEQDEGERMNSRQLSKSGLTPNSKSTAVPATVRLSSGIIIPINEILEHRLNRFDSGIPTKELPYWPWRRRRTFKVNVRNREIENEMSTKEE
jgi:hypothetical protein